MKLWTRFVVVGLALALALSLGVDSANAASKKKKKETKKQEKKETRRESRHEAAYSGSGPIAGGNMSGKPGYLISDTAHTLNKGQVMGAAHLTFDTWGNALMIPIGVSYGITDKVTANLNTGFYSWGGSSFTVLGITTKTPGVSGLNNIGFGGKYGFGRVAKGLDIAAGLDFTIGPLSNTLGPSGFGFDPYGVATWTLPDGLQFNGKLGLYVQSIGTGLPAPFPQSVSYSFFQLDLGMAYPFDRNLTGIAELATNGVVNAGGLGGTPLVVGIRTGKDVQFQALAGLDLGGVVGLYIGGGVVLISQ
jgi:hypothetical protein